MLSPSFSSKRILFLLWISELPHHQKDTALVGEEVHTRNPILIFS